MYTTQVETATLPVSRWLSEYRFPARFRDACKACPDYGRVWSCPPGVPEAEAFFSPFSDVTLIAVRVIYSEETRRAAASPEETEQLRKRCYGTVKKQLLATQLALEKQFPGTLSIAAGRCEQCERCTRPEGAPCRMPDRCAIPFRLWVRSWEAGAGAAVHPAAVEPGRPAGIRHGNGRVFVERKAGAPAAICAALS